MHGETHEAGGVIVSAGYDWITAYGGGKDARARFQEIGDALITKERNAAEGESAASRFGFEGYRGKHWFFGSRMDGRLIVLSSELAVHAGQELIRAATNVSRLDLQVTFALDFPIVDLAAEAFRELESRPVVAGHPPSFQLIHTKPEGQTLNVNKRISDTCARLYDKGVESKLCPAGRIWRWELELKRHRAWRCALASLEHSNLASYSTGCVKAFFRSKGLEPPWTNLAFDLASQLSLSRISSDPLGWLRKNVSHTVRRLINTEGTQKVVEALGLDQLVQVL